jgi:hypothetical protein
MSQGTHWSVRASAGSLLVAGACASYSSETPAPVGPTEAGRPDAALESGALDSSAVDAKAEDSAPDAAPAAVLYVSAAAGNDASSGLSVGAPLKSLGAALGLLEAKQLEGYAIHMCAGDYPTASLATSRPIAIRGGYNCSTWTRSPKFGKVGGFADGNQTRVSGSAQATGPVLTVDVAKTFALDGVEISSAKGGFATVKLTGAGQADVADSRILGAVATGLTDVSIGLESRAAETKIEACELRGGNGVTPTDKAEGRGSLALVISSASTTVRKTALYGGTGMGVYASGGAYIRAAGPNTSLVLADVDVFGEAAQLLGSKDGGYGFIGLDMVADSIEVRNVRVKGGQTSVARLAAGTLVKQGIPQMAGMYLGGVTAKIENSRVDSGDLLSNDEVNDYVYCYGLISNVENQLTIENSAISAGCTRSNKPLAPIGVYANAGKTLLRHATVIAGPSPYNAGANSPTSYIRGVYVDQGAQVDADNSLFLVSPGVVGSIVRCRSASLGTWRGVAGWAGTTAIEYIDKGASGACDTLADGDGSIAALGISNAALPSKLESLISVSNFDDMRAQMFAAGIVPSDGLCTIARGVELMSAAPADIDGRMRNRPPSVGAWEARMPKCP